MRFGRDERRFDFHKIGLAIKRAREAKGMTQEDLAYVIDRTPRTIMYNENNGQHPSLNAFYSEFQRGKIQPLCKFLENFFAKKETPAYSASVCEYSIVGMWAV